MFHDLFIALHPTAMERKCGLANFVAMLNSVLYHFPPTDADHFPYLYKHRYIYKPAENHHRTFMKSNPALATKYEMILALLKDPSYYFLLKGLLATALSNSGLQSELESLTRNVDVPAVKAAVACAGLSKRIGFKEDIFCLVIDIKQVPDHHLMLGYSPFASRPKGGSISLAVFLALQPAAMQYKCGLGNVLALLNSSLFHYPDTVKKFLSRDDDIGDQTLLQIAEYHHRENTESNPALAIKYDVIMTLLKDDTNLRSAHVPAKGHTPAERAAQNLLKGLLADALSNSGLVRQLKWLRGAGESNSDLEQSQLRCLNGASD